MIAALWTIAAVHRDGTVTQLGTACTCYQAALDLAKAWRVVYRCRVDVLKLEKWR